MNPTALGLALTAIGRAVREAQTDGLEVKFTEEREVIEQTPVPDDKGKPWARYRGSPMVTVRITLTDPSIPKKGEHPEDVR